MHIVQKHLFNYVRTIVTNNTVIFIVKILEKFETHKPINPHKLKNWNFIVWKHMPLKNHPS